MVDNVLSEIILAQIYFLYLWHVAYIYETVKKLQLIILKKREMKFGVQNVSAFKFG